MLPRQQSDDGMSDEIMQTITYSFVETPFFYDSDEYCRWRDGDEGLVRNLVGRCGPLGRSVDTYINQLHSHEGQQNYPEVRYAVHLVESEGFRPECVVYENFRLCSRFLRSARPRGPIAAGTGLVRGTFSDQFFEEYDRLASLNECEGCTARQIENAHVDLCAVDPEGRRIGFYETKRYRPSERRVERVGAHQLRLLAAVRHLADTFPGAFHDGPWTVTTEIVAFVTASAERSFRPGTHRVELKV